LVASVAPSAIRRAGTMGPQRGARLLLTLRLLPAVLSCFAVFALCVPSYLRFEPRVAGEKLGIACMAAAIVGAWICAVAVSRALSALIRSSLYLRQCGGLESRIDRDTVWIVPRSAGLALAGIVHPRLLISQRAISELSRDELAVALRHEHAHQSSRDNLKRLLILLAPAILPRLRTLEQAWAKCAEWAADDRAVAGDADRSLALAAALLRVARQQSMPLLITSLVEADEDLSLRVDRLLHPAPLREPSLRGETIALSGVALAIAAIALYPSSLRIVHQLLERIYDLW
jgi:beta-lactamase regulating signal transducer with metallopeptidase domain